MTPEVKSHTKRALFDAESYLRRASDVLQDSPCHDAYRARRTIGDIFRMIDAVKQLIDGTKVDQDKRTILRF